MSIEDGMIKNIPPSVEDNTPHDLEIEGASADLALGEMVTETETKDAQRIQEINRIFDEVSWYSKEGKLQLAGACKDFVRSYETGAGDSFSDLMRNQQLMPKTLEALRNIFLFISEFSSSERTVQDNPEVARSLVEVKHFLAVRLASEVENIDMRDQEPGDVDLARTNQNNAFYVVSEALGTEDVEKQKVVEKWLVDNVDALLEINPFKSSADGVSTTVFKDALRNTSLHATDAVAGKFLKIAWDISEKESDGGTLWSSETYSEVVKPILDRKSRPTMVASEEIVLQAKQEYIASMMTGKFGLDPSILEKWRVARMNIEKDETGVVLSWEESYGVNLLAAEILELKSQGSAKRLFEEYCSRNTHLAD